MSLGECLDVLNLTEIPDSTVLKLHFKKLLKMYHPDRNPDRPGWAHERTKSLLHARKSLHHHIRVGSELPPPPVPSKPQANFSSRIDSIDFQLIDRMSVGLALPVTQIERILPGVESVRKNFFGHYVLHEGAVLPIRAFPDQPLRLEEAVYFAVIRRGEIRFALPILKTWRFDRIINVRKSELMAHSANNLPVGSKVILLSSQGLESRYFIYPESWLQGEESKARHKTA